MSIFWTITGLIVSILWGHFWRGGGGVRRCARCVAETPRCAESVADAAINCGVSFTGGVPPSDGPIRHGLCSLLLLPSLPPLPPPVPMPLVVVSVALVPLPPPTRGRGRGGDLAQPSPGRHHCWCVLASVRRRVVH